jgi:hypothetical protein
MTDAVVAAKGGQRIGKRTTAGAAFLVVVGEKRA